MTEKYWLVKLPASHIPILCEVNHKRKKRTCWAHARYHVCYVRKAKNEAYIRMPACIAHAHKFAKRHNIPPPDESITD